jgi:hypothetical protein
MLPCADLFEMQIIGGMIKISDQKCIPLGQGISCMAGLPGSNNHATLDQNLIAKRRRQGSFIDHFFLLPSA